MKKFKFLYIIFLLISILLFGLMCSIVSYNYCNMQWAIKYQGTSAPASVAYLYAIPYLILILICLILARIFYKKYINK